MISNISLYEMIDNIVHVVLHTHFSYVTDYELKRDLMQVGYLKAYDLLSNGNYDPSMSLRNFLYTGIRNEMHNTLYRLGKIPTVSLDSGLDLYENVVGCYQVREYSVQEDVVMSVCNKFRKHGNYFPVVANYLHKLGVLEGTDLDEPEVNNDLIEGIITLTLWTLYEFEVANG